MSKKQNYTFVDGLASLRTAPLRALRSVVRSVVIGCVAGGGIMAVALAGIGWMVMG